MNRNCLIAREALPYLSVLLAATVLFSFIWLPLGIIFFILLVFTGFFFRNPRRKIVGDENIALSPADGRIMSVEEVSENNFLNTAKCWKVTIFLSIFNVHFNRVPASGTIEKVQYVEGKFFPAFKSHAGTDNERNYVLLNTARGKMLIVQITGFIARRIVCYVKGGEALKQGERFGLIKFGSCTELYLPLDYEIKVKAGEKVRGGVSIIGTYKHN